MSGRSTRGRSTRGRVTGLVRLAVACTWRSWRWLPPYVIVAAALGILYLEPAGPALGAYAVTVVLMVPVTAWLVAAAGNVDDDAHKRLLAAATSVPRLHLSRSVAGVLLALPLVVLCPWWPLLIGQVTHPRGAGGLVRVGLQGVAAHAVGTALGAAIGTLAHRPVLRRTGGAAIAAVLGTMAVVLVPPLLPLLHALAHQRAGALVWALPASVAIAAGASAVGVTLARRTL